MPGINLSPYLSVSKLTINICFLVTALVLWSQAHHNHEHGDLTVPYNFSVYSFKQYQGLQHMKEYYKTSVVGKPMCDGVDNLAGCLSDTAFTDAVREKLSCPATQQPSMCTECVDFYAPRVQAAAADVETTHAAPAGDSPTRKEYRLLLGCLDRHRGPHEVHDTGMVNPWLQFVLWCLSAFVYSVGALERENEWVRRNRMLFAGGTFLIFVAVAAVVLAMTKADYDLIVSLPIMLICLVAQGFFFTSDREQDEAAHVIAFGIYLLSAAPCIAVIVCTLHAWLEWHMITLLVSVLLVLFTLSLCDDVLCIYWATGDKASDTEAHMHLHGFIFVTAIFAVFFAATLNLPMLYAADTYNGTLLFALVIVFAIVCALAPTVLYEATKSDTLQLMVYKELLECVLRLIFAVVFISILAQANH